MTAFILFIRAYWPALAGLSLIALVLLLVRCSDRTQDNAVTQARNAGAAQVREESAIETLNRTMEAHNAAEAVRTDPAARRASCLRHSRIPENC